MLNPVHLRTLQEIVRSNSFAAAANRLGYTASAVSQQMAALEQVTGTVLFDRTARSIRPTPAAHLLARRAAKVLHALDALQHQLSASAEARRQVSIGVFPSAALYLLPDVLTSEPWRAVGAEVSVRVAESSELIHELVAVRSIDVAFVYRFERSTLTWPTSVRTNHVWADPLVVIMPAEWSSAQDEQETMADLAVLPWVTHVEGTAGALSIERTWATQGLTPRIAARCDDYAVTTELVRVGVGAAIVPSMVAQRAPEGVVVRRPRDLLAVREVAALTREGTDDPVVDTMVGLFGQRGGY